MPKAAVRYPYNLICNMSSLNMNSLRQMNISTFLREFRGMAVLLTYPN